MENEYTNKIMNKIEDCTEEKWRMRISFTRVYLKMILLGISKDLRGELKKYGKEYDCMIENEMEILSYLLRFTKDISHNNEVIEEVLEFLYLPHLKTFQYYEYILSLYDTMFLERYYQKISSKAEFPILDDCRNEEIIEYMYTKLYDKPPVKKFTKLGK